MCYVGPYVDRCHIWAVPVKERGTGAEYFLLFKYKSRRHEGQNSKQKH